jgi:peptidoglycan/LPS O-acetylase OafA/YrhL
MRYLGASPEASPDASCETFIDTLVQPLSGETLAVSTGAEVPLQAAPSELTAHRRSLKALTGIRFFAAYYVVIFHSRLTLVLREHGWHAASNFIASGYLAVPLFFLLSGFILAYTYEGQIERPGDHRRFWEARFSRIWPVYAVALLLSSLPGFSFPSPGSALAALAMVQAWNPFNPGVAGTWNLVCWTLSVEALFYLVFPWFQVWLEERSSRWQMVTIVVMIAVCVATNSASRTLGYTPYGWYRWIPLPVLHLSEFFTGVGLGNYFLRLLARARTQPGQPILPGGGAWTYISLALSVALLCRGADRWTSLVVAGFSALIFGLAAERTLLSRFLSTKAMMLGGGISYSVYLMQMPVKTWVILFAERTHLESAMLRLGLTAAVLTLISLMLFKTVEDPARKVLRGMFARLETRREKRLATRVEAD